MKTLIVSFVLLFSCASPSSFQMTRAVASSTSEKSSKQSKLDSGIDFKELETKLTTEGLTGWIHGKNVGGETAGAGLAVFTFRNPNDFFDNVQMTLLSDDASITQTLNTLGRHDKVKIKGKFLPNPSPQKHILVSSLEVVQKFSSSVQASAPYEYEAKLPEELLNQNEGVFLVHAITGEGKVLILEYKDTVVPVFVKNPSLTKDLYRNDIIKLKYTIQRQPGSPIHLNVGDQSIEVLESIVSKHGKPASVEGALILFPKSPEIIFNVFAVDEPARDGLGRQYTLVNFESPDEFKKIREKLQKAWDLHSNPSDFINVRNKFKNLKVRVKATGVFNEVDKNQANAQILLKNADSIEIIEVK